MSGTGAVFSNNATVEAPAMVASLGAGGGLSNFAVGNGSRRAPALLLILVAAGLVACSGPTPRDPAAIAAI